MSEVKEWAFIAMLGYFIGVAIGYMIGRIDRDGDNNKGGAK